MTATDPRLGEMGARVEALAELMEEATRTYPEYPLRGLVNEVAVQLRAIAAIASSTGGTL